MPDIKLLLFNQQQQDSMNVKNLNKGMAYSAPSSESSSSARVYTDHELERIRQCGNLFDRRQVGNQEILQEFFRKEPCLYKQIVYKNAARIFHCLKANLNENPILKSLKQQKLKEMGKDENEKQATEVPKIKYENSQEKRNTLQLAFSTLKFQKVLEDLLDICQFYGTYPDFKDEQSLVCTVLFDYMTRKFQLRDKLNEEPFDNFDHLITEIETSIFHSKTDLAAELAKSRIKEDALTIEELLPQELREVEQHKAELPLYCWVNTLKISTLDLIQILVENEDLKQVDFKKNLDRRCFMIDPHCPNVLMFHFALREKITNHELVKSYKLIIQDKSSCLAPHTIIKLLSKKDDVVVTNMSGGLVAAFIGCMMEDFEGKIFVYGATNEDKHQEISAKLNQIGCGKMVKLVREDFLDIKADDPRMESVKVILINAPCSKSALMNPMEFLFQEGEDEKFLRDYTLDVNNKLKLKKCVQSEQALLKHALNFNRCRAIAYQTYSKNSSENEQLVTNTLRDFNDNRNKSVFPYKISPPVIPLTAEDIQNDEVVKDFKFLQFKPSNRMNGCFIALLSRDRDGNVDKEARRAEALIERKTKPKLSAPATFQEKNFLRNDNDHNIARGGTAAALANRTKSKSPQKKLSLNLRKNSLTSLSSKNSFGSTINAFTLEEEIRQLQIKSQLKKPKSIEEHNNNGMEPISFNSSNNLRHSPPFENRLANIGKLDSNKKILELPLTPNRSSTPDEKYNK